MELDRRQQSFTMRRQLLRSNPALYIGRTRLSISNLPIWVSERGLKRLATHAMRAFEQDVKQGGRAPPGPLSCLIASFYGDTRCEDCEDRCRTKYFAVPAPSPERYIESNAIGFMREASLCLPSS